MGKTAPLTEEERLERNRRKKKIANYKFKTNDIHPITDNQEKAFHSYFGSNKNLLMHGVAGTGKTFIAFYLAICDVLCGRADKIVIVRSAVQGRQIGFMPGTEEDKLAYYETPYVQICAEILGRKDAYEQLKKGDHVQFMSTAFIRGITLDNAVVIVDEAQNCNFHELDSLMTRIGENSRLIICGDYRQDDLKIFGKKDDVSGIIALMEICKRMSVFDLIEFEISDIVRSDFVKEYITIKTNLNL